jgi:hypothetical protein
MKDDPIVEEARKAGQAYVNQFDGKLADIIADLRRRTRLAEQNGSVVVSRPPAVAPAATTPKRN